MCGGEVGTTRLMKEKKERFGQIDRNNLHPGLRRMQLHTVLFACPCTTECRESESSPYPMVGRGLAPTGDCTANRTQQEWVGTSIPHPCRNRPHPPLTGRRQPCPSRAIKIVSISKAQATWGAGTTDNHVWNDTAQRHPGLSPDNQCLHQLWN